MTIEIVLEAKDMSSRTPSLQLSTKQMYYPGQKTDYYDNRTQHANN